MVRSKEELMEALKARTNETADDDTLAMLEDVSDTLTDLESKIGTADEWKRKFEENDASWRQKYRDRFFNKEVKEDEVVGVFLDEPRSPKTFEDLFK